MKDMKEQGSQLAGLVGIICFLFGLGYFLVANQMHPYVILNIIGGMVLLFLYLFTNLAEVKTFFGERQRTAKFGTHAATYTILVLVGLVLINVIAARRHVRWDLTESRRFSLSEQSRRILKSIKQNVEILGFFKEGETQRVEDLLKMYAFASNHISYRFVDPQKRPDIAERHGITRMGTLLVQSGQAKAEAAEPTEEAVTNAFLKVMQTKPRKVCFLSGHGEHGIFDGSTEQGYQEARLALENENYQVEELNLTSGRGDMPEDCTVLVVGGPKRGVTAGEISTMRNYVKLGGKALFLLDPNANTGLENLVREWGIQVGDDVIIDIRQPSAAEILIARLQGQPIRPQPVLQQTTQDYGSHEIVEKFTGPTIFSLTRSVEPGRAEGFKMTTIVRTQRDSWAETDVKGLFQAGMARKDPNEKQGPISIAVAASGQALSGRSQQAPKKGKEEQAAEDREIRLVVFGDSDFVQNNRDLFLRTVSWLAGRQELISIPPKKARQSKVSFSGNTMSNIFTVSVLVFPQMLLIVGLAIWRMRR